MIVQPRDLRAGAEPGIGGVGLRPAHYPHWHAARGALPWLEVMADNYLFQRGGPGLAHLDRIASKARLLVHGVGLSIASKDPLSIDYLRALRGLCDRYDPGVVSDHLCFTRANGLQSFDLLPIPYTRRMLRFLCERVQDVQDALGRRFALENVSSYVSFAENEMTEIDFLDALCARTGCGLLLDVNNVFVSARNHGLDAHAEIAKVNPAHVVQYHVAGHSERDGYLHDTHDQPVRDEVWELCAFALGSIGPRPFILENDDEGVAAEAVVLELSDGLARVLDALRQGAPCPDPSPAPLVIQGAAGDVALRASDLAWQDEFLSCVQSNQAPQVLLAASPALARRLEPATRDRIDVYRIGYFSRVTATLAETLFEKASALVSREYIQGVLGRYFEAHPARHPMLVSACPDLPGFARALTDTQDIPWLADFLALCLARWETLTGPDPDGTQADPHAEGLEDLRLQENVRLVESDHPLFSLWNLAERIAAGEELSEADTALASEPQNVLLFKSAPTVLEMVRITPSFLALLRDLERGARLGDALEGVERRGEDINPESFAALISALTERNAWRRALSLPGSEPGTSRCS